MFRVVTLSVLFAVAMASEGSHWTYGETGYGPYDWSEVSKHCSESAQSPINIDDSAAKPNSDLKGLRFTGDNSNGEVSGNLINNGHAPTLSIDKSKGTASLTGGPLGKGVYKLEQLHFHFGCLPTTGSEHTLNGYAFPGELHLVTYNTKYSDFTTAADKTDGLSVIGVFLKEYNYGVNFELYKLSRSYMRRIRKADSAIQVNNLALYKLVPQLKDLSEASFYSYKGSLTTPPCYQSVNWIVLTKWIVAHEISMRDMRGLHDHKGYSVCDNFRPVQPLNGRIVSKYSD